MDFPNLKLSCPTCGAGGMKKSEKPDELLVCSQGHGFRLDGLLKGQRRVIRNKLLDSSILIDEMMVALRAKLSVAGIKNDMERVLECTQDMEKLELMQTAIIGFEKCF